MIETRASIILLFAAQLGAVVNKRTFSEMQSWNELKLFQSSLRFAKKKWFSEWKTTWNETRALKVFSLWGANNSNHQKFTKFTNFFIFYFFKFTNLKFDWGKNSWQFVTEAFDQLRLRSLAIDADAVDCLMGNRFHVGARILSPELCKKRLTSKF